MNSIRRLSTWCGRHIGCIEVHAQHDLSGSTQSTQMPLERRYAMRGTLVSLSKTFFSSGGDAPPILPALPLLYILPCCEGDSWAPLTHITPTTRSHASDLSRISTFNLNLSRNRELAVLITPKLEVPRSRRIVARRNDYISEIVNLLDILDCSPWQRMLLRAHFRQR